LSRYYVLQLLRYTEPIKRKNKNNRGIRPYRTINRWGRVGDYGQTKVQDFDTLAEAKADFKKKFAEKTRNKWEARQNFVKHPNKYDIVELYYEIERPEQEKAAEVQSQLTPKLQDFMSVITDMDSIKR
jgi:predicted DNA-binding WGR domain protein